jgi:MoxR-like ATPase
MTSKKTPTADWKVFHGDGRAPHKGLADLPLPPWRTSQRISRPESFGAELLQRDALKAKPFLPDTPMVWAVNAALYLRRPLLLTGKAGSGKSTLISKVAQELMMGPVLRWDITSRSTVRSGIYDYDAVGRLQKVSAHKKKEPPIRDYLSLGPLGTAMLGTTWPRALLIDEIDKGDLDLANDLLNVIEEGTYDIPELRRLEQKTVAIRDGFERNVRIRQGRLECRQFPFVVMTSNAEREFPPPFLRRCVRLTIKPPEDYAGFAKIVNSHLENHLGNADQDKLKKLITVFLENAKTTELATDQLLNAVFLIIGMSDGSERRLSDEERKALQGILLEKLA